MVDLGTTKVVELGGRAITAGLSRAENFGGDVGCSMGSGRHSCTIAPDSNCRVTRAIYRTSCLDCDQDPNSKPHQYVGTTGRTLHSRNLEHQDSVRNKSGKSALSKHQLKCHRDGAPKFQTEIIQGGIQFNLDRFVRESLEIEKLRNDQDVVPLNQRSEWGHKGLPRINVQR